jgi:hypothetical protein
MSFADDFLIIMKIFEQSISNLPIPFFIGSSDSTIKLWKGMTCHQTFTGHTGLILLLLYYYCRKHRLSRLCVKQ